MCSGFKRKLSNLKSYSWTDTNPYNMWCLVLQTKGTTRNAVVPTGRAELLDAAAVGTLLRRTTNPEYIGKWKWNNMFVHLFAYKTGKAGTENKHELPPPHDTILLFGEALLCATLNNVLVSFGAAEYKTFYNDINKGFEDLDSEDDEVNESEEEEEEEVEEEADEVEAVPEEEEEEVRLPFPKVVKSKKPNKKIPTWFSVSELEPEVYTLVK
jgi:hypothetical protein